MAKGFQAPPGTRDFYPQDLLRRRYIEKLWRDTSIRHGFEEIDGPTFEHADLYAVKSGEGILSELFQTFSGKDPEQAKLAGEGKAPYALRPEFTPTLARMYAARAGSLPKPCRWFWMQNCYRAERQQRGRLREFAQWNCDVLGGEGDSGETSILPVVIDALHAGGLRPDDARLHLSHKNAMLRLFPEYTISPEHYERAYTLLDARDKMNEMEFRQAFLSLGVPVHRIDAWIDICTSPGGPADPSELSPEDTRPRHAAGWGMNELVTVCDDLRTLNNLRWCLFRPSLARGLAYYTGMVFEVLAKGERAIAGGGRYDHLIELFGGPPTPAVGFGMGDVVLSLVLQDRGLMPEGPALLDALSRPHASYRPDAFVISNGCDDAEKALRPLLASLRRGVESDAYTSREGRKPWDADRYDPASNGVAPLHARTSAKSTKNVGKLIKDAADQGSRFALVLESGEEATLQNLSTQDKTRVKIAEAGREIAARR